MLINKIINTFNEDRKEAINIYEALDFLTAGCYAVGLLNGEGNLYYIIITLKY